MPRRTAPPFHGPLPREDTWDLVIKVKYGDTLRRFNAYVNGPHFDHNLAALRSKIASAFKFSSVAEFILTYTDEDGDIVMLDDDNDLRDAAIHQRLNPLRINVQLKSSSAGGARTKQQASNFTPARSTALEDQLAQVKSAIDEALKFIPEQVPSVLAKLSQDLRSRAASSTPSLAELLSQFAKLMTSNSNMQPSNGPADGSSGSRGGQTPANLKINHESELTTVSASQPSKMQNSESSKAPGLKSMLVKDSVAPATKAPKVEQASGYPLISTSLGGKKSDHKGSTDAQSKGKSVISSAAPPVATVVHGVPTLHSGPAPSMGGIQRFGPKLYGDLHPSYMPFGANFVANGKINGELHSIFPPPPVVTHSYPSFGANGKINGDLHSTFPPPPTYNYTPFKLNIPSSVSPYGPHPEGVYSFGDSYKDLSDNYGSMPPRTLHRWIQCDGCGVTPIVGPRYKSNVKEDYDLCSTCYSHMGNEAEYTRIENFRDSNKNRRFHSRLQARSNQEKLDCRFIMDVTVPDGTFMMPSDPFTKIWRIRNNGSTVWPFGTQLIWVGGDQFALQSSVKLGISVDGFPVDQEIDVAVDFHAPAKLGRYISYWRLALPSGQKFGQRVWVLIQVEEPVRTSGSKKTDAINLNLPPEGSNTKWKYMIDVNAEPTDYVYEYPGSTNTDLLDSMLHGAMKPKESGPVESAMPSAPTAVKPVQVPIIDLPTSSTAAALTSMPAGVPAPEPITLPKPVGVPAPAPAPVIVPAPAPAPATVPAPAPASVPTIPPYEIINNMEEKLLRELEEMGFRQVDLNKEILRQNKYDLQQSVDDLCGFNEWDPLLTELHELGFADTEMNKEALVNSGGSIKRAVMDLVAREKKDQ